MMTRCYFCVQKWVLMFVRMAAPLALVFFLFGDGWGGPTAKIFPTSVFLSARRPGLLLVACVFTAVALRLMICFLFCSPSVGLLAWPFLSAPE